MLTETTERPETLAAFCRARTLVLGVGNILFGDDGFGPEVVRHLSGQYEIPDDIYVMDVGTGARKILFTVTLSEARPEEIVIVDAVDCGQRNGEVFEIPAEALPENKIDDFSLHQVPTSNLLRGELQERCGVNVTACRLRCRRDPPGDRAWPVGAGRDLGRQRCTSDRRAQRLGLSRPRASVHPRVVAVEIR